MTILAREGEEIKGRDGKVIATVAADIHSGDLNIRPDQFVMAEGQPGGGFLPEEVYEFVRDRLSSPPQEPKTEQLQPEPEAAEPKPASIEWPRFETAPYSAERKGSQKLPKTPPSPKTSKTKAKR